MGVGEERDQRWIFLSTPQEMRSREGEGGGEEGGVGAEEESIFIELGEGEEGVGGGREPVEWGWNNTWVALSEWPRNCLTCLKLSLSHTFTLPLHEAVATIFKSGEKEMEEIGLAALLSST